MSSFSIFWEYHCFLYLVMYALSHWGRATHICINKLTIIASDNGLSLVRRQAIISTNAGILLIWTLGANFSEIAINWHPVDSPHKGQWREALMCSLIWVVTIGSANNRDAGDLRRHRVHYDATVMTKGNDNLHNRNVSRIQDDMRYTFNQMSHRNNWSYFLTLNRHGHSSEIVNTIFRQWNRLDRKALI